MYNFKYYKYCSILSFDWESLVVEAYVQHERTNPIFGKLLSKNSRNYDIDQLNKFGEYEKYRFDVCIRNVINLCRINHRIVLYTYKCNLTGDIKIVVSYWVDDKQIVKEDIQRKHLVPISQL